MRLDELHFRGLVDELPLLSVPKRILIVACMWLLFLVLGFFLFWKSNVDMSTQLEMDIEESLTRLNTQSQLLLDGPAIETELAQLEAQLPLLKMALPTERELASLLGRINELILDHELKLVEFTPQEPLNREVMRVVPVKVRVKGEGEAISRLPNYIAGLSRQVSLAEFEISLVPDSAGWQMSGELNAFAQLPVNTSTPAPVTEAPEGTTNP